MGVYAYFDAIYEVLPLFVMGVFIVFILFLYFLVTTKGAQPMNCVLFGLQNDRNDAIMTFCFN
ncbi:hypothetical protein FHS86_002418 [Roseimarinus sediminis]